MKCPSASIEHPWSDHRVLADLRDWMLTNAVDPSVAESSVVEIHRFYRQSVIRRTDESAKIGFAAKACGQSAEVWLHVLPPRALSLQSEMDTKDMNDMVREFTDDVALPFAPSPRFHVDFVRAGLQDDDLVRISRQDEAAFLGVLGSDTEIAGRRKAHR